MPAAQQPLVAERWVGSLVENAPDGYVLVDHDGVIRMVNGETERLTGYLREELVGAHVEVLVPDLVKDGHALLRERYVAEPHRRAMGLGRTLSLRRKDGTEVPVDVALSPITTAGETPMVLAAVRDVTLRREIEEQREQAERSRRQAQDELEVYQRVLLSIARGEPRDAVLEDLCREAEVRFPGTRVTVMLIDPRTQALHVVAAPSMPAAVNEALDGLPVARGMGACGTAAATLRTVVVEDVLSDPLTEAWVELAQGFDLRSVWSYPLVGADGRGIGTFAVYRSTVHRPEPDEVSAISTAAGLAELAIERAAAVRALTDAAQLDPLTGLPNRARFLTEVERLLADTSLSLAVLFLDLDRFKWVNDSLGHPAGDRLLIEVAKRLLATLDSRYLLARFGGDEFTLLVPDATLVKVAEAAERIEAAIREPFLLDGGEFFLSVSVGICMNDHPADAYELVRDADAAMYAAKERGRARHVMFDAGLRERAVRRVTREAELRRAVERHELVLHYQPVWSPQEHRWSAAEALVRWQHPVHGLLGPLEFIALAEDSGHIVPLGAHVLDLAVQQTVADLSRFPDLSVGVNVSVEQLADPGFGDDVAALLDRHGLPPHRLFLEVTESGLMEQLDLARKALQAVVDLGVRVLVDDFGTGYSSIARLGQLPVAGVKIDQSFAVGLGEDPRADRVLAAIVALAHAHGLYVVVEGVETAPAYAQVQALACEGVQGFHLQRPVALPQLLQVLERDPQP